VIMGATEQARDSKIGEVGVVFSQAQTLYADTVPDIEAGCWEPSIVINLKILTRMRHGNPRGASGPRCFTGGICSCLLNVLRVGGRVRHNKSAPSSSWDHCRL
jgi:hypothetical protein